jgi:GGDEF domain-containing protein
MSSNACLADSSITVKLPRVLRKRPIISRKFWPWPQFCCGCADTSTEPHSLADADDIAFVDGDAPVEMLGSAWRLLIVDDEPDVHRATLLAMQGVSLFSRPLEFLHAYSAADATEVLRWERDIAVVMLDVVMESGDAGLTLVKVIREELKLADLRIIMRIGQPGYAPEIETITAFDINDYRTKSELTRFMLYITIASALRSYQQIKALEELAYYDSLSCLPNRNRFIAQLNEQLQRSQYDDIAIAILDIDDFSEVNDAFVHQYGDRTLQVVAMRLLKSLGEGSTLARIGSDTFGVMGPSRLVEPTGLLALFHAPFLVQGDSVILTATLGLLHLVESKGTGQDAFNRDNSLGIFDNRREPHLFPRIGPQPLKPRSSFAGDSQSKGLLGILCVVIPQRPHGQHLVV